MAVERLCADCPPKDSGNFAAILEIIRAHPEYAEDADNILDLPNGPRILAALALQRPERYRMLRELLPPQNVEPGSYPFSQCAEVALVAQIAPDVDLNVFDTK